MEVSTQYAWNTKTERKNNPLLPRSIRGLIVGKSNCGKTTLLLNLLLQPGWLDYNHLYVFGKSLHQRQYKILRKGLECGLSKEQISNIFKNQEKIKIDPAKLIDEYIEQGGTAHGGEIKASFYDDSSQIPDPSILNEQDKNLLILDDCLLEKQCKAEAYYTRGRHNNCDSFYISQNYFRLPRQTIRENSNLIILFQQDTKNLNHIHADHCSDISIEEFKEFCRKVWSSGKHNFVTIDSTSRKETGKYRKNLDCFYNPTIMDFIDIKDPNKRDEIVADYLATIKKIQQRNEDEKASSLSRRTDLEHVFSPMIEATEKST